MTRRNSTLLPLAIVGTLLANAIIVGAHSSGNLTSRVPPFGATPTFEESSHGMRNRPVPFSPAPPTAARGPPDVRAPTGSTGAGPFVIDTLLLSNNTLVPGNFLNAVSALGPHAAAYDGERGEVFVATSGSNNVSVIGDVTNRVVATVAVGGSPVAIAYDSGKREVFVANSGSYNVSVISDATNTVVASVTVGTWPDGIAYDSGKGEVFVANSLFGTVSVINDATNGVVATVATGGVPSAVAYDNGKGEVFVANSLSNNVSVISEATNRVVATVDVGRNPVALAYDGGKGEVFVANNYWNSVSVISDGTNSVVATIPVGSNPGGVVYDNRSGEVFVTNTFSNSVSVISDETNRVVDTVAVGGGPIGVAFDTANAYVYVCNYGQGTVSLISLGLLTTHIVTFTEAGLPTATLWSVTLGGKTESATAPALGFVEPSGAYAYAIGTLAGYSMSPSSGSLTVNGFDLSVQVNFAVATNICLTEIWNQCPAFSITADSVTIPGAIQTVLQALCLPVAGCHQLSTPLSDSNLNSYPVTVYLITRGGSEAAFQSNLSDLFGVTLPQGYVADEAVLLHVPVVSFIDTILTDTPGVNAFGLSLPIRTYQIGNDSAFWLN